MCLKSGVALKYHEKGTASMAPIINHIGLLLITPAIEIANEDIMPGQPMSRIKSVVIKSNHFQKIRAKTKTNFTYKRLP